MDTRLELMVERSLGMAVSAFGSYLAWGPRVAGYVTLAFGGLILMIWVSGMGALYEEAQKPAAQQPQAPPPEDDI